MQAEKGAKDYRRAGGEEAQRTQRKENGRKKGGSREEIKVQVTGLDLRTVCAGKPRGVKAACKDKIEVENM